MTYNSTLRWKKETSVGFALNILVNLFVWWLLCPIFLHIIFREKITDMVLVLFSILGDGATSVLFGGLYLWSCLCLYVFIFN